MSRRALLWIAAATLFTAACGDLVQIGAEGDVIPPSPPTDACSNLKCGDPCGLTECSTTECPPSVSGFCDPSGLCVFDMDVACPSPASLCAGVPCGMPCGSCDPDSPNCTTSIDAGPGSPPMVCDAFQQCQAGAVECL